MIEKDDRKKSPAKTAATIGGAQTTPCVYTAVCVRAHTVVAVDVRASARERERESAIAGAHNGVAGMRARAHTSAPR